MQHYFELPAIRSPESFVEYSLYNMKTSCIVVEESNFRPVKHVKTLEFILKTGVLIIFLFCQIGFGRSSFLDCLKVLMSFLILFKLSSHGVQLSTNLCAMNELYRPLKHL